MSVAAVIGAALSHLYLLFYVLAAIVWWRTMRRARREHRALDSAFVFWGELLFWYGGLALIWAGFFHGYEQHIAASSIGWQPAGRSERVSVRRFSASMRRRSTCSPRR